MSHMIYVPKTHNVALLDHFHPLCAFFILILMICMPQTAKNLPEIIRDLIKNKPHCGFTYSDLPVQFDVSKT